MRTLMAIFAASTLLLSCAKSESTLESLPIITDVFVNGSTEAYHELAAGDSLRLLVKAIDNDGVSQVKIDIHGANDGHQHGKTSTAEWTYVLVRNTYGTSISLAEETKIPADAQSGYYHMIFRAIDVYGNESAFVTHDLLLHSTSEPIISFQSPDWGIVPIYESGDTIITMGTIEDVDGIQEISYAVVRESDGSVILQGDLDNPSSTAIDMTVFPGELVLPQGMSSGAYEFELKVVDVLGNTGIFHGEFVVQ